jgi:diguanylate cyclase (GGDEF) domain
MTALLEFRFFGHILTLLFSLLSIYFKDSVPFLVILWSIFVFLVIYIRVVEKKRIPVQLFLLPVFIVSGGVDSSPVLPLLFLALPLTLQKSDDISYFVFAATSFILMICSGNISDYSVFIVYVLFLFSSIGVWVFMRKGLSFILEDRPATPIAMKPQVSMPLVKDPFRPLKKYLVRTKNFNNKPVYLRLVVLLPGGMAKIYESDTEFELKGLLFRAVHDKTEVAANALLDDDRENIPMLPEYNFRIYYPVSLVDSDDVTLFDPEYVVVVDTNVKGKIDKEELVQKFSEIKDDVLEQLRQSETFSHISVEKQRNATLYQETSNIVDAFDHDELLKAAALAIFNLAPEASGVFVAKKGEENTFTGYSFSVKEFAKGKPKFEVSDINDPVTAEIKDPQSVHAMMVNGKIDDYYEATDVNKRKSKPFFPPEFDDLNKKSCIMIRCMTFKNDVKGTISVLTDTTKDFEELKKHSASVRMISKVVTSALNNIEMFQKMEELSNIDGLTGLYNRRCFNNMIEQKISEASRAKVQLSMVMLDIDFFKKVNDTYGHKAGDDVIRFISSTIKKSIRKVDFAARYGGEEFVILLYNTSIGDASNIAEKIRNIVRDSSVNADGSPLNITISLGVSSYPMPSMSADDLIKNADTALYYSKEHGRDQVSVFNNDMESREEEAED